MPWCDDCQRFWNPPSMDLDGTCPACGVEIADPEPAGAPWHFKMLLVVAGAYLGFRAIEGVVWVVQHV